MDPENERRPRERLSPETYWLRRVAALVGLFVVVGVIAWAASGGAGGDTNRANPVGSRSTAAGAPGPRPTVTVTVTVTPRPADYCADEDIEVKLLVDRETYPPGTNPTFTIYVVNAGDRPCKRDVGSEAMSLRVLSEGGLVWDSGHCAAFAEAGAAGSDVRRLAPGEEHTASVTWDRTASAPGCAGSEAVQPGPYQLVGAAEGVTSDDLTFYLR